MTDFKSVQPGDPAHLREAFALLGLAEGKGAANNSEVLALYAEAGFPEVKADSTAWCAAFGGAMLIRGGFRGSGSLLARSYLDYGDAVPTRKAKRGDIAVFKRGNSTWQGHVAFVLKVVGEVVWIIGGNQSLQNTDGAVTVSSRPASSLLGIRRPSAADKIAAPKAKARSERREDYTQSGYKIPPPPDNMGPREDRALITAVQQALLDKGWREVGRADGRYGPKTRGAILMFEDANGLPMLGEATHEIHARILASPHRVTSPHRETAPPAEIRAQVPEAKASFFTKIMAGFAGLGTLAVGAVNFVVENIAGAKASVDPVLEVLGDVPGFVWWGLLAGGLLLLFLNARKAEHSAVEAWRLGDRR